MDVGRMSWSEVVGALGGGSAAYKLESRGGVVTLSVDGLSGSLSRSKAGRRS